MRAKEVVLPELGEEVDEATVSYWLHQEGDEVKEGEDLVEMTTDKATFNVPSPTSGTLKEISAEEGETVKVGQKLATIE
ncbi:biotin attachment protein [candidate division NPL-UPA2 bacterium]|nr:biotin attachment protein [candidate division NPL-UPA2 bacterium]